MSDDFQALVHPLLEQILERGETLTGVMAATERKTFTGRLVAVAVTDRRLVVQGLNRRIERDGDAQSISPADVQSLRVGTAGSEWWNTELPVTTAALTMRLKTIDGAKLTLDLMRGGDGLLGKLGGGEAQQAGVTALADWARRNLG